MKQHKIEFELTSLEIGTLQLALTDRLTVTKNRLATTTKASKVRSYTEEVKHLENLLNQLANQLVEVWKPGHVAVDTNIPEILEPEPDWMAKAPRQRREFIRAAIHRNNVLELSSSQGVKFVEEGLARLPNPGRKSFVLTEEGERKAKALAKKDVAMAEIRRVNGEENVR